MNYFFPEKRQFFNKNSPILVTFLISSLCISWRFWQNISKLAWIKTVQGETEWVQEVNCHKSKQKSQNLINSSPKRIKILQSGTMIMWQAHFGESMCYKHFSTPTVTTWRNRKEADVPKMSKELIFQNFQTFSL